MSAREEKKMRQRLQEDRTSAKAQYGGYVSERAPERAAAQVRKGARYGELLPQFQNLAQTGGIDPEETGYLRKGYKGFSETGGLDPSATSNLRGYYGGMMSTGGYGAGDISNIRRRSNAAIPAVYSRLKEGVRRTGALNPAYAATMAKLGRQGGQEIATTTRDTEAGIAEALRSGRLQGAQGTQGLEESIREGKGFGLTGQQGLEALLRQGRLAGISGQQDLMNADIGEIKNLDANQLQALQQQGQEIGQTYSPDLSLATRPGLFSNILRGIGAGTSLASSFMGGGDLSSLLKPKNAQIDTS